MISAKSFIPNGLAYAQEFVFERSTLADDQLNLSGWGGFNELIWNTKTEWKEIDLKARLHNSYLWLFLTTNKEQKIGFRISTNSQFKSGFYELNADKQFIGSETFNIEPNLSEMNIRLSYENNLLVLKINDKLYFQKSINLPNRLFSFRSSLAGNVVVTDLQMHNVDNTVLTEDFSPDHQNINLILAFVFQILSALAIWAILKRKELTLNQISALAAVVTSVIIFWLWLDQTKISKHFYNISPDNWSGHFFGSSDVALEVGRKRILEFIYDLTFQKRNSSALSFKNYTYSFVIPENTQQLPDFAKPHFHTNGLESNAYETRFKFINSKSELTLLKDFSELKNQNEDFQKIVFIGSSQAYGGGSAGMDSIFVSQVTKELIKCSQRPVASVNISSPGDQIGYFVNTYKNLLKSWTPNLLIVSLGANENNLKVFSDSLEELIRLSNHAGAKTVFVKEANTLEAGPNTFADKYAVLDKLGQQYGLPVLDLDAFVNSPAVYDKGILWIDRAHFDRAGHNLVAAWLLDELKKNKMAGCW
ncbi:MAG: SGNH/GDSL hydrolase family protein [Pseudobdellovibrio sp.]